MSLSEMSTSELAIVRLQEFVQQNPQDASKPEALLEMLGGVSTALSAVAVLGGESTLHRTVRHNQEAAAHKVIVVPEVGRFVVSEDKLIDPCKGADLTLASEGDPDMFCSRRIVLPTSPMLEYLADQPPEEWRDRFDWPSYTYVFASQTITDDAGVHRFKRLAPFHRAATRTSCHPDSPDDEAVQFIDAVQDVTIAVLSALARDGIPLQIEGLVANSVKNTDS